MGWGKVLGLTGTALFMAATAVPQDARAATATGAYASNWRVYLLEWRAARQDRELQELRTRLAQMESLLFHSGADGSGLAGLPARVESLESTQLQCLVADGALESRVASLEEAALTEGAADSASVAAALDDLSTRLTSVEGSAATALEKLACMEPPTPEWFPLGECRAEGFGFGKATTYEACQAKCERVPECIGISFVNPASPEVGDYNCFLVTSCTSPLAPMVEPPWTSATVERCYNQVRARFPFTPPNDCFGIGRGSFPGRVGTQEQCAALCDGATACVGYSWNAFAAAQHDGEESCWLIESCLLEESPDYPDFVTHCTNSACQPEDGEAPLAQ